MTGLELDQDMVVVLVDPGKAPTVAVMRAAAFLLQDHHPALADALRLRAARMEVGWPEEAIRLCVDPLPDEGQPLSITVALKTGLFYQGGPLRDRGRMEDAAAAIRDAGLPPEATLVFTQLLLNLAAFLEAADAAEKDGGS